MSDWLWWVLWGFALYELYSRARLTRWVAAVIVIGFTMFDLFCVRVLQLVIRPKYALVGACHKRGTCCQHIVADPPRIVKHSFLLQLYAVYHKTMHRFTVVARGPEGQLIMSCGHVQQDGRCGIYHFRPRFCRNYPVLPFFGPPQLLPGCGFRVVPRAFLGKAPRPGLPIVNPVVASHHPTPPRRPPGVIEQPEDYHLAEP